MHFIKRSDFQRLLVLGILILLTKTTFSQVTIGSDLPPNEDALLELREQGETKRGLLLPRVALKQTSLPDPLTKHVEGMVIYNTAKVADVTEGFYYNNGSKWSKLSSAEDYFFYMPATALPTDENDPAFVGGLFSINLYDNYRKQFGLSATNIAVSDVNAKLPIYDSNELYYFVTYYDDAVFQSVSVNNLGILTYKLKTGFTISEKTFMNIILKVK